MFAFRRYPRETGGKCGDRSGTGRLFAGTADTGGNVEAVRPHDDRWLGSRHGVEYPFEHRPAADRQHRLRRTVHPPARATGEDDRGEIRQEHVAEATRRLEPWDG